MKKYFYLGLMSVSAFIITICILTALVSVMFYVQDTLGCIEAHDIKRMALRGITLKQTYQNGFTSCIFIAIAVPFHIWFGKQYEKHDSK